MFLKIWHFSASNYWLCHNVQQPITTLVTRALMLFQCIASWTEGTSMYMLKKLWKFANGYHMLFVFGAAARSSATSDAPSFHRNWDDNETTQQKHYVRATSCHAISAHVINSPTVVHQKSATPASSPTATLSTSASTTQALKRLTFLPEKLQPSGYADDRSQEQQFQHLCHDVCPNQPIPSWTSGISARGRCHHLLEETAGAAYSLLATLAQDLVAAPASQAYVIDVSARGHECANGWQLAAETECLKISKFACSWRWTKTWCEYDCVTE